MGAYTQFMAPVETACVCTTLRMATRSVSRLYDRALSHDWLRATSFAILSELAAEGSCRSASWPDAW